MNINDGAMMRPVPGCKWEGRGHTGGRQPDLRCKRGHRDV